MSKAGSSSSKTGGPKPPYPPARPASRAGSPVLSDIDKIHKEALVAIGAKPGLVNHVLSFPVGEKRTAYITKTLLPAYKQKKNRVIIHKAWPEIPATPAPSRPTTPPPKPTTDPTTPTPQRIASPRVSGTQIPPTPLPPVTYPSLTQTESDKKRHAAIMNIPGIEGIQNSLLTMDDANAADLILQWFHTFTGAQIKAILAAWPELTPIANRNAQIMAIPRLPGPLMRALMPVSDQQALDIVLKAMDDLTFTQMENFEQVFPQFKEPLSTARKSQLESAQPAPPPPTTKHSRS